jgi:hypothetical protein
MLLYITVEDALGGDTPKRSGPRPLHTMPATVAGLYDLGLRHHLRSAAMRWGEEFEAVPDWKLDRLAIRLALFGRERMGVEPGQRVAVLGRLGWLWPVVDFAAMGFGVVPVGLEHDLGDDALRAALDQAAPRAIFVTDPESAERVRRLRREGRAGSATIVADGAPEEDGSLPLARVLDLGSTLDTAERAQSFRAVSRQVAAESAALWHAGPRGLVRLTHVEAMARIAPGLRAHPAREGDVAFLDGPRASLQSRLLWAAFVGDGRTTTALGTGGRTSSDVAALRPHRMVVSGGWIEAVCGGRGPRWPAGVDRPWVRRRVQDALGGRARWVGSDRAMAPDAARALAAAGVALEVGPEEAEDGDAAADR